MGDRIPDAATRETRRDDRLPTPCGDGGQIMLNANVYAYPPITPAQLVDAYRNLRVRYAPSPGACIQEVVACIGAVYSNPNHPDEEDSNEAEATSLRYRIRDCRNHPGSPIRVMDNHEDAVIQCRAGRGAVQHYQTYLSYALSYAPSFRRPRIQPSELRHYCTERSGRWAWLGLDCIGFVNRYLMASGRLPPTMAGASPGIAEHRSNQSSGRRRAAGDIQALDLIIQGESGHDHIAIVNRVINRTRSTTPDLHDEALVTLEVCESSASYGGLLTHVWYVLEDRGGGNFRCRKTDQARSIQNDWGFYPAPGG